MFLVINLPKLVYNTIGSGLNNINFRPTILLLDAVTGYGEQALRKQREA